MQGAKRSLGVEDESSVVVNLVAGRVSFGVHKAPRSVQAVLSLACAQDWERFVNADLHARGFPLRAPVAGPWVSPRFASEHPHPERAR